MMAENPILSFFAPDLTLVFDLGKYTSLRWRAKYFEPGEFELQVGASSADIREAVTVNVTGETRVLPAEWRMLSTCEVQRA